MRRGRGLRSGGCGALLALACPESTVHGSDYDQGSIDLARRRAAIAGVANQVSFGVASAKDFSGTGYDLVATFDCLHDRGDPVGAARHVRESLARAGRQLAGCRALTTDYDTEMIERIARSPGSVTARCSSAIPPTW